MKKIITFIFGLFLAEKSFAHVKYVVEKSDFAYEMGNDFNFLLNALLRPENLFVLWVSLLIFFLLVKIFYDSSLFCNFLNKAKEKLESYHEYIPAIIRVTLGITLIGAGTAGVLISPGFGLASGFSVIQILLGFFFMIGFLLAPACFITIIIYFIALMNSSYMFGNLDFLALTLAFLVFHSPRPGLDDVLQISLLSKISISRHFLAPVIRFGIGFAMMYLALFEKILNPHISEAVVYKFNLMNIVPFTSDMWVLAAGLVEFFIGFLIFFGVFTRLSAIIAFLVLSLSFFYFKEAVYSHVTLFSCLLILLIEGGGYKSVDSMFKNKKILKCNQNFS